MSGVARSGGSRWTGGPGDDGWEPVVVAPVCPRPVRVLVCAVLPPCCRERAAAGLPRRAGRRGRTGRGHGRRPRRHRPTDTGRCSSPSTSAVRFGTTSFTEVPCTSERAAARVSPATTARRADGPPCPATTDFVLHISEQRPPPTRTATGRCRRATPVCAICEPPHPGDPGGGGGPRTVVGDCVYSRATARSARPPATARGGHRRSSR